VGLAMEALACGYLVRYTTWMTSFTDCGKPTLSARSTPSSRRRKRPHVLVIDKAGYVPLDRADANRIHQIVNRRYPAHRRSSPPT
jgi:DNA replication protein DnaC